MMRNYLKNIVYHYQGDYQKVKKALKAKEKVPNYRCDSSYVIYGEEKYPPLLYRLQYPPLLLFYKGNLDLCYQPTISIVGSRKASADVLLTTQQVVRKLQSKYVLVSGLALGVDGCVHKSALNQGKTIGVIGGGINTIYPKAHQALYRKMAKDHLILSEFPDELAPLAHHFPWRNRIIAALSKHLIVMSAHFKSGTMSTVNYCLQLNNEIYCNTAAIFDEQQQGLLQLINQGANILTLELLDDLINEVK